MDRYALLFTALKIFVVLMFVINTAAILTWGERRQSAMIQDRIGPNRAVIFLPSWLMKGISLLVGVGLAAAVVVYTFWAYSRSATIVAAAKATDTAAHAAAMSIRLDAGFGLTELAVFLGWIEIVALRRTARRKGQTGGLGGVLAQIPDARVVFYLGLVLHLIVAVLRGSVAGEPEVGGLAQAIFFYVGPALAALLLLLPGVAGAMAVPPGKVGVRLGGTLHALADGAKMAFKEDFIPTNADRLLHSLGPLIALFPAFVVFAVVPFGDTLCIHPDNTGGFWHDLFNARVGEVFGRTFSPVVSRYGVCSEGAVSLQVADLNVGILYMFALAGTGIIGAAIAGWSSDNKFSLLGGLRASSQMVSYEVAMGLSLVGAFMTYGSVRFGDMVRWQSENAWGIFVQPFAFILFLAASIAENKRVPFDAPEGESEIVAGYFLEYSGMKFGMFMLGEYMELAISSAVLTTVFFGGWALPFLHRDGITVAFGDALYASVKLPHAIVIGIGVVAFFLKTWFVCWAQLFIRWTIPRFRYDQIMKLGWKFLLPSALVNVLVTAMILLAIGQGGPGLSNALAFLGDVTQAIVAVGGTVGIVALISGILAPKRELKRSVSSSATFAEAQGGTKMTPMQA
jgi:NADH-quinone oxidoreductase subunit H